MIAPKGNFSADVELRLHVEGQVYELGQLGSGFGILREPQEIAATHAELETLIDGTSRRWPVRISAPITTGSKRFAFETA